MNESDAMLENDRDRKVIRRPVAFPIMRLTSVASVVVLAACSGDVQPLVEAVEVRDLGIETLIIVPPEGSIADPVLTVNPREQVAFSLRGTGAGGAEVAVGSDERRWRVSNSAVGGISDGGVFTAVADGAATISVGIGNVVAQEYDIVVNESAVSTIEPIIGPMELDPCVQGQYSAVASFVDGSRRRLSASLVDWDSADAGVRVEEDAAGRVMVSAREPGEATLTATASGASQELPITVTADSLQSIDIGPATLVADVDETLQLSATGTYLVDGRSVDRDITDAVDWDVVSGNDFIRVGNDENDRGRVTARESGSGSVRARCGVGVEITEAFEVRSSTSSGDDGLSFNAPDDGVLSIPFPGNAVQLRVSTGDSYSGSDEITGELAAVWSLPNPEQQVINLVTSGPQQGTVTPLAIGRTAVRVSYRGESADLVINVVGSL